MKIALLNLPFDNNYGGNLQRYALIKVLQGMGHEVEHINLQCHYSLPWYKYPYSIPKRMIKKYLLGQNDVDIWMEYHKNNLRKVIDANALKFYKEYIPHTQEVENIKQIKRLMELNCYDAVIVGSDQVWRKCMTYNIGCENYFLKFVPDEIKKIAYSVSMGTDVNEYNRKEIKNLSKLYSRFDAVSVREESALSMFCKNGWVLPKAEWTLDPTLLLKVDDYVALIKSNNEVKDITLGKVFSYVLDMNDGIKQELEKCGKPFVVMGLKDAGNVSIEQWLNNIRCSDMVITDSYHGVVFSIIFGKEFKYMGNIKRGNDRIASLMSITKNRMIEMKRSSLSYLSRNTKLENNN